jgi:hypothetical protein
MALRLSASRAGRPLPANRFLVLISVGCVDSRAIVRLEGLGKLKKNPPHRDSFPRPHGLHHSASTNYATAWSLDVSQRCGPPRPVTETALPFPFDMKELLCVEGMRPNTCATHFTSLLSSCVQHVWPPLFQYFSAHVQTRQLLTLQKWESLGESDAMIAPLVAQSAPSQRCGLPT